MKDVCLFIKIIENPKAKAVEIILRISFFLSEIIFFESQIDPNINVLMVNRNTIK